MAANSNETIIEKIDNLAAEVKDLNEYVKGTLAQPGLATQVALLKASLCRLWGFCVLIFGICITWISKNIFFN